MSQLPRPGGGCPVTTQKSKKVEKIPGTHTTVTTTKTVTTENRPSGLPRPGSGLPRPASGLPRPGASRLATPVVSTRPSPTAGLPASTRSQLPPPQVRQIARPQPQPSRLAAPRAAAPSRLAAPSGARRAAAPPSARLSPRPVVDISGQYAMPMEYGPASMKGKHMQFSSPADLRKRMEAKVPQELKYYANVAPPGFATRDRQALQKRAEMQDTLSGTFNVYKRGQAQAAQDYSDYDFLDYPTDSEAIQAQLDQMSPYTSPVHARTVDLTEEIMNRSIQSPSEKVRAKGGNVIRQVAPPVIVTDQGVEPVLQQTILEEKVERREEGERVTKHLTAIDVDERTGIARQVELEYKLLDPNYAVEEGDPDEVITVTSKLSITASNYQTEKTVAREVSGLEDRLDGKMPGLDMDPYELEQLVVEETEDIENTLKMVPPELVLSPEKFKLKKRLQNLRMNSESIGILEQSIPFTSPAPSADEAQNEPSPETLATIMHTVENGVTPQTAPVEVFNTLFSETNNREFITMNSVAEGPLQDVVVPTEMSPELHKEALNEAVQELSDKMDQAATSADIPQADVFTRLVSDDKKKPNTGTNIIKIEPVGAEQPPWGGSHIAMVANLVGAKPIEMLGVSDLDELEKSGNLNEEMATGMEYFVEANPLQYMSRVQLRGSTLPKWFPGYMIALPEFPDLVKVVQSPNNVFSAAWKSVQPKLFSEDAFSSVNY